EISEEPGNEWIGIRDDNSRQQIRIDRSQNKIELTTQGDVKIAGNNIQLTATSAVTIKGSQVRLN
ncbi:MAG: hypothetical protein Q7O66_19685, partial [Dehalococcoidia bacterium]|nr:hypothetical protein [Dehalococcoidia bacterium]